jgi:outer membrane lipopolysaccharide assembly protein LptE/RlpB
MGRSLRYRFVLKENCRMKISILPVALLMTLALAACGRHMSGTYVAQSTSPIVGATLDFISASEVQVQVAGTTTQGTYKLENQQVVVMNNNQTQVFAIESNGCLNGGPQIGTFCKR